MGKFCFNLHPGVATVEPTENSIRRQVISGMESPQVTAAVPDGALALQQTPYISRLTPFVPENISSR